MRPAGISATPNASAYPEMIQLSVASDASRLSRIVGRATLTIVVSSRAMNMPAMSTINAFHALRGTVGGCQAWAVVASVMGRRPSSGSAARPMHASEVHHSSTIAAPQTAAPWVLRHPEHGPAKQERSTAPETAHIWRPDEPCRVDPAALVAPP